jgi:cytidine deaminase
MLNLETKTRLITAAQNGRACAYAPYSNYPVSAALLTTTGKIFTGVNVENAAYPTTMCAERVAIFSAVTAGEQDFVAIVVMTDNGGSPCGSCRQVLAEFGLSTIVIIINKDGDIIEETTVGELLPGAFTPKDLL